MRRSQPMNGQSDAPPTSAESRAIGLPTAMSQLSDCSPPGPFDPSGAGPRGGGNTRLQLGGGFAGQFHRRLHRHARLWLRHRVRIDLLRPAFWRWSRNGCLTSGLRVGFATTVAAGTGRGVAAGSPELAPAGRPEPGRYGKFSGHAEGARRFGLAPAGKRETAGLAIGFKRGRCGSRRRCCRRSGVW